MAARAEGFAKVRAAAAAIVIQPLGRRKASDAPNFESLTQRTYIRLQYAGDNALIFTVPLEENAGPHDTRV
ncbi:hypothetical protein [uncultured Stenotrophomonas sp.]|uniref:hypothetical protein n=1 Tax=uncultured Stenotrophomonas sp. TaxID=165438 RepID=UPI0025FBAD59|nr:hypothetical protein [uncultured Stenotrophomonas sp.]